MRHQARDDLWLKLFGLIVGANLILQVRNDELRAMLRAFIGQMTTLPSNVWGGVAATRFKEVVDRWDAESTRLHRPARLRRSERLRSSEVFDAVFLHRVRALDAAVGQPFGDQERELE